VTLSPAFRFAYGSPGQRIFLLDGPVTYLCDPLAGTLVRYAGYSIAGSQAARDSDSELLSAGASRATISNEIETCSMAYAPGTSQRAGLVSMQLAVAESGEVVSLQHQIHVSNVP
jgi:MSHA biogenesis protein MshO